MNTRRHCRRLTCSQLFELFSNLYYLYKFTVAESELRL